VRVEPGKAPAAAGDGLGLDLRLPVAVPVDDLLVADQRFPPMMSPTSKEVPPMSVAMMFS